MNTLKRRCTTSAGQARRGGEDKIHIVERGNMAVWRLGEWCGVRCQSRQWVRRQLAGGEGKTSSLEKGLRW